MGSIEVTDLNGNGPYVYRVNHMHMHGPAEHHIDDYQYDLEVHIVHELVDGPPGFKENYHETLAVIGFLFKVDSYSHPFIEKLRPMDFGNIEQVNFNELFQSLDNLDAAEVPTTFSSVDQREFYHYKGSLTNPPCADVVNWIIYKRVLPITAEHLHAFKSVWLANLGGYGNYRECQPLCGRRVVRNFQHVDEHTHACDSHCSHTHHDVIFGKESEKHVHHL